MLPLQKTVKGNFKQVSKPKKGTALKKTKPVPQKVKEEHACYILITCGPPSADGKLAVEFTYEGDPTLASYLLESAQGFIEHEEN